MFNLLAFAVTAFIAFMIGVIKARTVTAAAVVVCDRIIIPAAAVGDRIIIRRENGAAAVCDLFNAYIEVIACCVLPRIAGAVRTTAAAGRTFAAAAADRLQALHGAVIESCSDNLPQTSIYALTITAADVQYSAGEYLVRDNGRWTNVYLTSYARTLIGTSADVITLNPAITCDARGTQRVWFVSL